MLTNGLSAPFPSVKKIFNFIFSPILCFCKTSERGFSKEIFSPLTSKIISYSYVNENTTNVVWQIYGDTDVNINIDVTTPNPDVYGLTLIVTCSTRSAKKTILKAVDYIDTRIFTNVEDLGAKNIKIYPNPTSQNLIIQNDAFNGKAYNIDVYNTLGKLLYNSTSKSNKIKIDVHSWANGIYFISVNGQRFKFIKQ